MSYSKFRLKQSNRIFYYQIENNSIHDFQGRSLSLPSQQPPEFFEQNKHLFGTRKKTNKPTALRILFGQACNYSCSYCMQKDIGNPDERSRNKNLQNFIDSLDKYLDLENLERIELWGGEPFLYWNDIKPVMEYLDKEGRHFFISTNGSPLRKKHTDFFNSLKATVLLAISHDGPGQELLRGEDILEKSSVVDTLKIIDQSYPKIRYGFSCVVSLQNYDFLKINEYFTSRRDKIGLNNASISFILGRIYDETNSQNSADHVITGEHIQRFNDSMIKFMDAEILQLKQHGKGKNLPIMNSNLVSEASGAYEYAKKMRYQIPVSVTSSCGADAADILSIDIMGNVRLCPHTSEKYIAGKIDNLKGIRIVQLDLNRKKTHCSDCNVRRLCKSSCPISFPDEVFLKNCRVEKVWYGNIQKKAFELIFGEEAELVELGIDEIRSTEDTTESVTA